MRAFHTLAVVAALLSLTACGLVDSGDDSQGPGAESSARIGQATLCQVDADCNDDNACTTDTCNGDTGTCSHAPTGIDIRLNDYNLFLLGDYNLGTDVEGKVAAAGNITMDNFSVGWRLPDTDIANTLVAGGNLRLTNGGIWGDTWHGGSYSADQSVVYPRGTVAQGSPIDFTARGVQLRSLSAQLGNLTANGTTTRETWGGIMLRGTDAQWNVFDVNASDFTGATLWSIQAPADSFVVVNIRGSSATFGGFSTQFSGGIDQHGVLYNFVDTTSITAQGFGFWGTVLAPRADIHFTNGSFDGGIYARSLTGNAEGHINALREYITCEEPPPGGTDGGSGTPDGGSGTPDGGSGTPDGGSGTPDGGNGTPDGGSGTPDGGNGTPDGGHGGHDGGCPDDDHGGGHDDDDDGHGGGGHDDDDDGHGGGHDDDDDGHGGGGGGHHDDDGCPGNDHGGGGGHDDDDDDGHGGGGGHHDDDGCPGNDHGGGGGHDDDDDDGHGGGGGGHHDGDGCPGNDHGGGGGHDDDDDDGHGGGGGGHHDGDGCPGGGHGGGGGHDDDDDGHGGGGGGGGHHDGDGCPGGHHGGGGGGGGHGGGGGGRW